MKKLFILISLINIFSLSIHAEINNSLKKEINVSQDINITKTQNSIKSESYFGALIQSLATLFAVLLGSGLSLYTIKTTTKMQRLEQLREKQLNILLLALKDLQSAIHLINITLNECKLYTNTDIVESKKIILSKLFTKYISDIEENKYLILIRKSELKMLKLGDPAITYIATGLEELDIFLHLLKNDPLNNILSLEKSANSLKNIFQNILDTSIESLYE